MTLTSGVLFGFVVVFYKFGNLAFPLTHRFNEVSYYIKNGFVLLVLAAVFLLKPSRVLVLLALLFSVLLTALFQLSFPDPWSMLHLLTGDIPRVAWEVNRDHRTQEESHRLPGHDARHGLAGRSVHQVDPQAASERGVTAAAFAF